MVEHRVQCPACGDHTVRCVGLFSSQQEANEIRGGCCLSHANARLKQRINMYYLRYLFIVVLYYMYKAVSGEEMNVTLEAWKVFFILRKNNYERLGVPNNRAYSSNNVVQGRTLQ